MPSNRPLPRAHHCTGHFPAHSHLHHRGWEDQTVKVQEEKALSVGLREDIQRGKGRGRERLKQRRGCHDSEPADGIAYQWSP